jgi:hypothetical protein
MFLSLLDAADKSEWHNITRPEAALAAPARAASGFSATGFQPKLPPNGPLLPPKGLHHPHHEQLAPPGVRASATCKPESRRTLKGSHQTCDSNLGCGP